MGQTLVYLLGGSPQYRAYRAEEVAAPFQRGSEVIWEGPEDTWSRPLRVQSQSYIHNPKPQSLPKPPKPVTNDLPKRTDISYEILSQLGSGTTAVVSKARVVPSGQLVAIKEFSAGREWSCVIEAKLLRQLNHKNIIKYIGEIDSSVPAIITALMEGDLYKLVKHYDIATFRGSIMRSLLQQILSGIQFLEEKKWVNWDIKPANILFECRKFLANGEPVFGFVIGDFGIARQAWTSSDLGTPGFTAPELYLGRPGNSLADIWSFFSTMVWIWDVGRGLVWRGSNNYADIFKITCGVARDSSLLPNLGTYHTAIRRCLSSMGWAERAVRASAEDCLQMLEDGEYPPSAALACHEDVVQKVFPLVQAHDARLAKEEQMEKEAKRKKEQEERQREKEKMKRLAERRKEDQRRIEREEGATLRRARGPTNYYDESYRDSYGRY
ncbi:hypothetical protein B7494_g4887 [Chlorociboria aeruginascens]|nr:hypothetical protein B7494_g4887 [Chlorociboria aeruginascens]